MKCPYCGGSMDKGKILGRAYWLPEGESPVRLYRGAALLNKGGLPLWDKKPLLPDLMTAHKTAWHCPECRVCIFTSIWAPGPLPGEEEPNEET